MFKSGCALDKQQLKTIWLSDIHLGSKDCKAQFLLDFLNRNHCDTLYLVGDIIDLWAMKRHFLWPDSHQQVLDKLLEIARSGTRVIYIPGNHDDLANKLADHHLLNIEIISEHIHTTTMGKKLLIVHGDQFDPAVRCSKIYQQFGTISYSFLLFLNRWSNLLRRWTNRPYWSLAYYLKNRVRNARAAILAFEQAAVDACKSRGLDGIVCGHIHQPELRQIDGIAYCNDGDWVESCTALVEDHKGRLELVHWGDIQHALKSDQAANDRHSYPGLDAA